MRRPASGGWTPRGPTSLGNPGCHRLCLHSCPGSWTRDAGWRRGCWPWQEEGRTQTHSGTVVAPGVLSEGREQVSDQLLLSSHHRRAHANGLDTAHPFIGHSMSCQDSFTPGRGKDKKAPLISTASLLTQNMWSLVFQKGNLCFLSQGPNASTHSPAWLLHPVYTDIHRHRQTDGHTHTHFPHTETSGTLIVPRKFPRSPGK